MGTLSGSFKLAVNLVLLRHIQPLLASSIIVLHDLIRAYCQRHIGDLESALENGAFYGDTVPRMPDSGLTAYSLSMATAPGWQICRLDKQAVGRFVGIWDGCIMMEVTYVEDVCRSLACCYHGCIFGGSHRGGILSGDSTIIPFVLKTSGYIIYITIVVTRTTLTEI